MKSGVKLGRKVTDVDAKWAEKWFEIRCKAAVSPDNRVADIIVKLFSKFWTKGALIEGECCHQVLTDGAKSYVHDGLLFELRDCYKLDNIAVRSQRPSPQPAQEEVVVPLEGLEFGRPAEVTVPEAIAPDNVHQFKDQDVFKILESDSPVIIRKEPEE